MAQDVTQQQGTAPARQGGEGADRTRARAVFRPRTDIYETAEGVVLLAEMPGWRRTRSTSPWRSGC